MLHGLLVLCLDMGPFLLVDWEVCSFISSSTALRSFLCPCAYQEASYCLAVIIVVVHGSVSPAFVVASFYCCILIPQEATMCLRPQASCLHQQHKMHVPLN